MLYVAPFAYADGGPAFDLAGPHIQIKVTREGKTLPIGEVASLAPGDRLWVHPDLPLKESVHYVLVVAFLRGATNPPPESWFTKAETWNKKIRDEGIFVTVPQDAQQVLLFLAPETGGDFTTLRDAVRGKPGAFVRAAQDLHQASLDRARLDTYLAAVKAGDTSDPKIVAQQAKMLARSLNIKLDQQCFDKPTEQQAPCLVQNPDQLILDNGRSKTVVQGLTSGAGADMMSQMAYTQPAGGGYYSVYLGTVMDLARILDSFHTAQYQYLPALAILKQDTLVLRLNNPPSFHKPQSVLVVGLPAVEVPELPTLHPVDASQMLCAQKSPLVLSVEGAPYVFATGYAHDFVLRIKGKSGQPVDLPAKADPVLGGFVVDTKALAADHTALDSTGLLRGYWGFQPLDGPTFHLASAHAQAWTLAAADQHALILGRKSTIHLDSAEAACVDDVTMNDAEGKRLGTSWKMAKPNTLEVDVSLEKANEGALSLLIKQAGVIPPDKVSLHTYREAGHVGGFTLNAGDRQGVLTGSGLDQVASLTVNEIVFKPSAALSRVGERESLLLATSSLTTPSLQPNDKLVAKVMLKDGRELELNAIVQEPRPKVTLISKTVHMSPTNSVVQLGNPDEVPEDGKLTFFVKSETPATYSRDQTIEVRGNDNSFHTMLSMNDGGIVLQDATTARVTLDPMKAFGGSAFGAMRFRPVYAGSDGDWQPLAILVRVPQLKELKCSKDDAAHCTLVGADLFLLAQVGADSNLDNGVTVPEGFDQTTLSVPHTDGTLYLRLRDNPAVINKMVLPIVASPGQPAATTQVPGMPRENDSPAPAPNQTASPQSQSH